MDEGSLTAIRVVTIVLQEKGSFGTHSTIVRSLSWSYHCEFPVCFLMRNMKHVDTKRRGVEEDLGRIMEGENIINIYNIKVYFQQKKRINCNEK